MFAEIIGGAQSPPSRTAESDTWGSGDLFQRLTDVSESTAVYWLRTVHRPAHRVAHPAPMVECPGCVFEAAVTR